MGLQQILELREFPFRVPLPERPPGFTGEDVPIYLRWRLDPSPRPEVVFFNVRVGPRAEDLGDDADPEAALAASVLALRIDALVRSGEEWWVLEYHRSGGLAQFGRAVAYPELLRETYGTSEAVRSAIVVYTVNPFLLPLFTRFRIPVFRVPPEGGALELLNAGAV